MAVADIVLAGKVDSEVRIDSKEFITALADKNDLDITIEKSKNRRWDVIDRSDCEELLSLFLPELVPVSLRISNIDARDKDKFPTEKKRQGKWRFSPRIETEQAHQDLIIKGKIIAFIAGRKQGKLSIQRISAISYLEDENIPKSDLVYRCAFTFDEGKYVDDVAWEVLQGIPRRKRKLTDRAKEWLDYLQWCRNNAEKNQVIVEVDQEPDFSNFKDDGIIAYTFLHSIKEVKKLRNGTRVQWVKQEEEKRKNNYKNRPTNLGKVKHNSAFSNNRKNGHPVTLEIEVDDDLSNAIHRKVREMLRNMRSRPSDNAISQLYLESCESHLPEIDDRIQNSLAGELAPINRQATALNKLLDDNVVNSRLSDFIFDYSKAESPDYISEELPFTSGHPLNILQKKAILSVLNAQDVAIIQGPPGTGKTTVIAEICRQVTKQGKKVLVSSQTNLAVDNALSRLLKDQHVLPLRLGSPESVTPEGEEFIETNVVNRWFQGVEEEVKKRVRDEEYLSKLKAKLSDLIRDIDVKPQLDLERRKQQDLRTKKNNLEGRQNQFGIKLREIDEKVKNVKQEINFFETLLNTSEWYKELLWEPIQIDKNTQNDFTIFDSIIANIRDTLNQVLPPDQINSTDIASLILYCEQYLSRRREIIYKLNNIKNACNISIEREVSVQHQDTILELSNKIEKLQEEVVSYITSGKNAQAKQRADEVLLLKKEKERLEQNIHQHGLTDEQKKAYLDALQELEGELRKVGDPDWRKLPTLAGLLDSVFPSPDLIPEIDSVVDLFNRLLPLLSEEREKTSAVLSKKIGKELNKLNENLDRFRKERNAKEKESESIRLVEKEIDKKQEVISSNITRLRNREKGAELELDRTLKDVRFLNYIKESNGSIPSNFEELSRSEKIKMWEDTYSSNTDRTEKWRSIRKEWLSRIEKKEPEDLDSMLNAYMSKVNVLGATCDFSSKETVEKYAPIDYVIIDEVSKATPPELLVPMILGKKVVLVGDHRQLPPLFRDQTSREDVSATESDKEDHRKLVERYKDLVTTSYFEEAWKDIDNDLKTRLVDQYRMHSEIMQVVNHFYPDLPLRKGSKDLDDLKKHNIDIPNLLSPRNHLLWIDSSVRHENGRPLRQFAQQLPPSTSRFNQYELEIIEDLLYRLNDLDIFKRTKGESEPLKIAVITFYGDQVKKIEALVSKNRGKWENLEVRSGTVDRFQGAEREIVIVSFVGALEGRRVTGFTRDFRRINVAISRAQKLLIILGSKSQFEKVKVSLSATDNRASIPAYGSIIRDIEENEGFRQFYPFSNRASQSSSDSSNKKKKGKK